MKLVIDSICLIYQQLRPLLELILPNGISSIGDMAYHDRDQRLLLLLYFKYPTSSNQVRSNLICMLLALSLSIRCESECVFFFFFCHVHVRQRGAAQSTLRAMVFSATRCLFSGLSVQLFYFLFASIIYSMYMFCDHIFTC